MPSRRDWLIGSAALLLVRDALAQGRVEQGMRRAEGDVKINGQPAGPATRLRAGDSITTGGDALAVFVVGTDAMLVRRETSATLLKNGLRIASGAVLSVFASGGRRTIETIRPRPEGTRHPGTG